MSKLPTYGGYTQDNLNTFIDDLNSYFSIKGITKDDQKIVILQMQLWHAAKIFADSESIRNNPPTNFGEWLNCLTHRFVTWDIIAWRRYDFYDIS